MDGDAFWLVGHLRENPRRLGSRHSSRPPVNFGAELMAEDEIDPSRNRQRREIGQNRKGFGATRFGGLITCVEVPEVRFLEGVGVA